jgi:hypothetical protein
VSKHDDIAFAVSEYIEEVSHLVTLPDYSDEDKARMVARRDRLQAMTLTDPVAIIKAHIPSITDRIEGYIDEDDNRVEGLAEGGPYDEIGDYVGDMRECACGEIVNGFYEYVEHLKEVLS